MRSPAFRFACVAMLTCGCFPFYAVHADDSIATTAKELLAKSNTEGGLVVHLGVGDGRLTAALHHNDRYLVHGLGSDPAQVEVARKHIKDRGLYGKVSVESWNGPSLPYADQLVNLVVIEDAGLVPAQEWMRVLVPGGSALVKSDGTWQRHIKPRSDGTDEWSHFLYDASGNAVSRDREVGPPRHMQWVAGPRSARGHENLASLSVAVSSGGRVFYIADEGPIASVTLPSDWQLVARDAHNGVLLWKKKIPTWEWRLRPFRSGPADLHRRLVALDGTVYVTLGYGAPVTAHDAATGESIRTYAETEGTEEIVFADGVLYLVVGDPEGQEARANAVRKGQPVPPVKHHVMAVDAESGRILWKNFEDVGPELFTLTLCVGDERVFFQTTETVVALDAKTGKSAWKAERPAALSRRAWASPTLVVHDEVLLTADQTAPKQDDGQRGGNVNWQVTFAGGGNNGEIVAYSKSDGKKLWSAPCRQTYNAPPDVLIADGLIWSGQLIGAREPGITAGRDPLTGEVKKTRKADQNYLNVGMSHHRCYRNRGTEEYLVLGRSGVEFLDLTSGEIEAHHWVRGTCQHGVIPANGLLYVTPHTCGCFIKAKLNGFNALAPADVSDGRTKRGERLMKGPAYKDQPDQPSVRTLESAWPTYRGDAFRRGAMPGKIGPKLSEKWQLKLGGRLSGVTSAHGKAYFAQIDEHTVHAVDLSTGEIAWAFVAGGRIDSPPTVHGDLAILGSADGWVYCLRASDGELVWKFRAAPGERRVVSYGGLESAWPVSGSVLVLNDEVYCAAGRSSFLDGGIQLVRLNAATGELIDETTVTSYDDETGEQVEEAVRVRGMEMPGALPDVLSSDGESIFMRHLRFSRNLEQLPPDVPHLFSSVGFLDDTWWHRTYFIFGTDFNAGWGGWWRAGNRDPAGRLLAISEDRIYGFGRSFIPGGNSGQWRTGEYYRFYATPRNPSLEAGGAKGTAAKQAASKKRRRGSKKPSYPELWSVKADFEARAMVLVGDTLFAAGPQGPAHMSLDAFEGRDGVVLRAMSTTDGSKLAEVALPALPVYDGLCAADGNLLLTTKDGTLRCFTGGE